MRRVIPTLISLVLLLNSGCSLLDSTTSSSEPSQGGRRPSAAETAPAPPPQPRAQGIEITWEVPSEPVDGFVVRYGYKADTLDQEYRVRVTELKEEKDTEFGPVYRHTIPNVDRDIDVYVSLAAFKGDRLSDFSDAIREPGSRPVR